MEENTLETHVNNAQIVLSNYEEEINHKKQENEQNNFVEKQTHSLNTQIANQTSTTQTYNEITFGRFVVINSALVIPGMIFFICIMLLEAINLAYIGQTYNDDQMVRAIGLSYLYMNCTMFAIVQGLISAIDPMCSSALAYKNLKLLGIYLHKARIIAYAATIIIVVVHIFTFEKIIGLIIHDLNVMKYATRYTSICLIYIFFDVQGGCLFRYLNVIGKSHVNMIILIFVIFLHFLWNFIFITTLDLEVTGAAISFLISRFISAAALTLYVHFWNPCPESYFCINRECFIGLWEFLKISVGSAIIMCAEWWAMEVQGIIAVFLSADDYTTHVIIAQFYSLLSSINVGFGFSVSILTGKYIVKAPVRVLIRVFNFSVLFGFITMTITAFVFYYFRYELFTLYLEDRGIFEIGVPVMGVIAIAIIVDNFLSICMNFFKSLGKHFITSVVAFIQFYVVMTFLSYFLSKIMGYGVLGIWLGVLLGNVFGAVIFMIIYLCLDFEKIKIEIINRLKTDEKEALINKDSNENRKENHEIFDNQ